MWVRKSEEEIQAYRNRKEAKSRSLLRPLLFALALTAGALILYLVGYRGGSLRMGIVMLSNPGSLTLGMVIPAIFFFVIFFAFTYFGSAEEHFLPAIVCCVEHVNNPRSPILREGVSVEVL